MKHKVHGWVVCGALCLGNGQAAIACAFHGYTPNPTLVDLLLMTEQVVTARVDPSDPSRFKAVDTLMGPEGLDIPVTVTPKTRAELASDPSATILLARDGAYGSWIELALLDPRYSDVIAHVVQRQSAWANDGDAERLALFAKLVNDPNPDLRRLALQELDRVPYSALQSANLPVVKNLRRDLESGDRDMMPIRILLAGLSQDASLAPFLTRELDAAIQTDVPYLGAYATALIELEGQTAVDNILDQHLRSSALTLDTREKLLQALAIQHKAASAPTRRAIAIGVAELLRGAPELRPAAERQFGFRSHWSLSNSGGQPNSTTSADR